MTSQYAFLVEGGTPIIVRQSDTGEQRILVVDLNNENQVHALDKATADNLVAAGRLKV